MSQEVENETVGAIGHIRKAMRARHKRAHLKTSGKKHGRGEKRVCRGDEDGAVRCKCMRPGMFGGSSPVEDGAARSWMSRPDQEEQEAADHGGGAADGDRQATAPMIDDCWVTSAIE